MVGNLSETSSRSTQAARLKKKCFALLLMYVIWWDTNVLPSAVVPVIRRNNAPSILMPSLLAECILVVTGMRDEGGTPIRWSRSVPARQLWHPVSASACMVMWFVSSLPVVWGGPIFWRLALRASTLMGMLGWGSELLRLHACVRSSHRWLSSAIW